MARLGLNTALPEALGATLDEAGAASPIRRLFQMWTSEIGPDFWCFCNCGAAQAWTVREILSLTPARVLAVSLSDPHPPPYLRVLLAFEWCRAQWGRGPWDLWTDAWLALYPLKEAAPRDRRILEDAARFLPAVSRTLLRARFDALNQAAIPSLFDLESVAPARIDERVRRAARSGVLDLSGLSPCGHLAVFNALRAAGTVSDPALDRLMSRWLVALASAPPPSKLSS
jgi:hypothetical protein